jgi:hypothetical protein
VEQAPAASIFKLCEIASLEHRRATCFRRFRHA